MTIMAAGMPVRMATAITITARRRRTCFVSSGVHAVVPKATAMSGTAATGRSAKTLARTASTPTKAARPSSRKRTDVHFPAAAIAARRVAATTKNEESSSVRNRPIWLMTPRLVAKARPAMKPIRRSSNRRAVSRANRTVKAAAMTMDSSRPASTICCQAISKAAGSAVGGSAVSESSERKPVAWRSWNHGASSRK